MSLWEKEVIVAILLVYTDDIKFLHQRYYYEDLYCLDPCTYNT
jgi:hypothetical protein